MKASVQEPHHTTGICVKISSKVSIIRDGATAHLMVEGSGDTMCLELGGEGYEALKASLASLVECDEEEPEIKVIDHELEFSLRTDCRIAGDEKHHAYFCISGVTKDGEQVYAPLHVDDVCHLRAKLQQRSAIFESVLRADADSDED